MTYSKGNPSEYTGRFALILECLETDGYKPFVENTKKEIIKGITGKQYNRSVARDVKYKVMIGRKIVFMNHLCFLEEDDFVEWQVAPIESHLLYL